MQHGPIRVIIVDDHQMVRETWKMILQKDERITIIAECSSGEEAIQAAERLGPDVMLMDINMSPVNGFEATRRITKSHPGVKIIGMSIQSEPSYARNMLHLGARGYVTKNSHKDEMLEAIMQVCNGDTYLCNEVKDKMFPK
jgi:DNA-binding NarL/FixJ family response regulator